MLPAQRGLHLPLSVVPLMLTRQSRMALTHPSHSVWQHHSCWQHAGSRYPFPAAQIYLPPISCITWIWCIGSPNESDTEARVPLRRMDGSFQSETIGGVVITHILLAVTHSQSRTLWGFLSGILKSVWLAPPFQRARLISYSKKKGRPITSLIWLCMSFR